MEEHRVSQAKIVEALEAEKRKISKELEEMQKKRALRENQTSRNGKIFQITTGVKSYTHPDRSHPAWVLDGWDLSIFKPKPLE